MKREEEIEKQAKKFIDNYMQSCIDYRSLGYHQRKTILNVDLYKVEEVYEEAAKWADKTMLDKACEWLAKHISPEEIYDDETNEMPTTYLTVNLHDNMLDFINDFRRAMKGGTE